jgi:hypothetical protein
MNGWLGNANGDQSQVNGATSGPTPVHPAHKIGEFPPYTLAFWDYPVTNSTFFTGQNSQDPSNLPQDSNPPSFSGRHMDHLNTAVLTGGNPNAIGGGTPCVFIDGHAELLAAYQIMNFLDTPGRPIGSSAFWTSPTYQNGGWNVYGSNSNYAMNKSIAPP